jgi:hypothetical protein
MALPAKPMSMSPAVESLGLGDALSAQVKDETDEERKRRIKETQERSMMGPSGSLATLSLFGGSGGPGV